MELDGSGMPATRAMPLWTLPGAGGLHVGSIGHVRQIARVGARSMSPALREWTDPPRATAPPAAQTIVTASSTNGDEQTAESAVSTIRCGQGRSAIVLLLLAIAASAGARSRLRRRGTVNLACMFRAQASLPPRRVVLFLMTYPEAQLRRSPSRPRCCRGRCARGAVKGWGFATAG